MFHAYRGPLDDEFLTQEHDPAGTKRLLRRELDLFGNIAAPEATVFENEGLEIRVEMQLTEQLVGSLRNRYRDCFDMEELEDMADAAERFIEELQSTSEELEPKGGGDEAYGRHVAQQALIATSVAIAQSLRQLFLGEIDDRRTCAAMTGEDEPEEDRSFLGESGGDWPEPGEESESWDIGTVMDADGAISSEFTDDAFDDGDVTEGANNIVLDEEILDAAMDVDVNMKDIVQSFDAIHSYLDDHLAAEGVAETSPEYQKAHVSLMHAAKNLSGGTITLRKLLELREHPTVVRILAPLIGDEAICCFSSVFHDVAVGALYEVKKFSDMVDDEILKEESIEDFAFVYAVELVTRNGLA